MARSGRILVVDDEVNARTALAELLRDEGYEVETAADAFKALGKYATFAPHVVVTDLKMPGMDGIELVKKIRAEEDAAAVVVMTAFGAVQTAVDAMRAGAADYLTKPLDFNELLIVLEKVLDTEHLRRETRQLRAQVRARVAPNNIIGDSPPMQQVFEIVDQVAPSRATVLLTGQSGTGKELVASAIHQRSPRANGPFIKLHCAALAESLLESELFGHERGAFTGAMARKDGRFSLADGGTLFLDEIGEISPAIQVKLLRFLQEHEFERVGGTQTIKVDVRVVAATNRDLAADVKAGTFREDLYYRIAVVELVVPPLRDRKDDIPALAEEFARRYGERFGLGAITLEPALVDVLVRTDWPGNVRQLENTIARLAALSTGGLIGVADFHAAETGNVSSAPASDAADVDPPPDARNGPSLKEQVEAFERGLVARALDGTGGNQSEAARRLGVSRVTLIDKMKKYALQTKR